MAAGDQHRCEHSGRKSCTPKIPHMFKCVAQQGNSQCLGLSEYNHPFTRSQLERERASFQTHGFVEENRFFLLE